MENIYKDLYYRLFSDIGDIIQFFELSRGIDRAGAVAFLKTLHANAEERYIASTDDVDDADTALSF